MGLDVTFELKLRDMMSGMWPKVAANSKRAFDDIDKSIGKTKRGLDDIGRKPVKPSIDMSGLDAAGRRVDELKNKLDGLGGSKGMIGSVMVGNLAASGIEKAASWAMDQAKSVVSAGMEGAATKTGFEVMAGGQKGDKLYGDVTKYIQDSVFGNSLYGNSETLLGFGDKADSIMGDLKMLGDVSRGNSARMDHLSLVYGQSMAAGKLTGGDVLQYINSGFNPLQEISRTTGKSMAKLREEMEAGKISFDMVKAAFVSATSEGGRYYHMLDKIGKTPFGRWEAMKGNIENAKLQLGTAMLPGIERILGVFQKGIDKLPETMDRLAPVADKMISDFELLEPEIEKFGKGLFDILKPIGKALLSDEFMGLVKNTFDISSKILNKLKPVGDAVGDAIDIGSYFGNWKIGQIKNRYNYLFDRGQYDADNDPRIMTDTRRGYIMGDKPLGAKGIVDSNAVRSIVDSISKVPGNQVFADTAAFHAFEPILKGLHPKTRLEMAGIIPLLTKADLSGKPGAGASTAAAAEVTDSIVGGGRKVININFRNFTEHFTVQNNGGTMDEQGWKTEAWFKEMFVRLLAGVPA